MDSSSSSATGVVIPPRTVHLKAIDATPETFAEFGQVISSSPDNKGFGPDDAQLDLHCGTPRFYIMHLQGGHLNFSSITHHASVTQCLGPVGGEVWFLGVAKATTVVDPTDNNGDNVVKSASGHYYVPPNPNDVRAFRIVGPKFLKLNNGTWHAGPLFRAKEMDFYNLELSNTNVVDHTTHNFRKKDGVIFFVGE